MFDDGSDELLGGLWPFLKRILVILLPIWVYLLTWTTTHNLFLSAIVAGLSIPILQVFEKMKLKQKSLSESNEDNVIK